jgi:hypothetical protein
LAAEHFAQECIQKRQDVLRDAQAEREFIPKGGAERRKVFRSDRQEEEEE